MQVTSTTLLGYGVTLLITPPQAASKIMAGMVYGLNGENGGAERMAELAEILFSNVKCNAGISTIDRGDFVCHRCTRKIYIGIIVGIKIR
jgi:hypothetical protein